MPVSMKIDDEIRIKILEALVKKAAVKPNIEMIKKYTNLHKGTILSSLKFLEEKGIILGYGPKIDFRKLGYKLEAASLLQLDLCNKELFEEFLSHAKKDPNIYWISGILGASNWNVIMRQIHADVESYQKHMQENYYNKIKDIYKLISDRQIFFTTEPVYKNVSRTESLIEIIKQKKGFG